MTLISRNVRRSGVYFVTTDTWHRRRLFINSAWAELVCDHICECREREYFLLHEFVLMPDHLHLLISPAPSVTIEKAMQMIKGGAAFKLKREFLVAFSVWHAGFHDRWIRDAGEYRSRAQYIRLNPVRARLTECAEEYQWSSASGRWKVDPSQFEARPQGLKPLSQRRANVAAKAATYKAKPSQGTATSDGKTARNIQAGYKSHKPETLETGDKLGRARSQGETWLTN